ncbi:MAG TPA: hypothetical protein DDZ89_14765, partial [Clostridiales bacterium]|nr:hypothetical protein [Clostridiales bacterium]
MMNKHMKIINIFLVFTLTFTGLPVQFFNFNKNMHVYADQGASVLDKGYDNLTNKENSKFSGDSLNENFSFSAGDAPALSNAEAVAVDKAWLIDIMNGYFLGWLQEDLILQANAISGSSITWSSSNTDLIDSEGKVNRPSYSGIHSYDVVLTATITKETASDTAVFDISVAPLFGSLAVELYYDDIDNISNSLKFNGTAESGVTYMSNTNLFSLNCNSEAAGSVFTKNKIQIADDLSFSTYFIFDIYSMYQDYDEGFTFTLQADSNTALGTGLFSSLGVPDISPSLSIEFDTKRDSESAAYEYQGTDTEQHLAVYTNGDYQNPISVAPAAISNLKDG